MNAYKKISFSFELEIRKERIIIEEFRKIKYKRVFIWKKKQME